MKKIVLLSLIFLGSLFTTQTKAQQIFVDTDSAYISLGDWSVPQHWLYRLRDSLSPEGSVMEIWAQKFRIISLKNAPNFGTPSNLAWIDPITGLMQTSPVSTIPLTSLQVTSGLAFTPVNNATTITINGSSMNLSTNRSWNVGDVVSTSSYSNPNWITALAWTKITGAPSFLTSEVDGSVTNEIELPTMTGQAGKVLSNNGTASSWITNSSTYYNTVAIAGGAGASVYYVTSDKTSSGTALYTTIDAVIPIVNDATTNYTYGWSYNAGTKALTVTTKYSPGLVVGALTLLGLPQNAPNGTSVQVIILGH